MTHSGSILFARQPILDLDLKIAGYELLFRSSEASSSDAQSAESMTADVATRAMLDIGLDTLIGPSRAWINCSRDFLVQRTFQALSPERIVLEVLESVQAEPAVLDAILEARAQGFTIALDDFEVSHENAALLDVSDYVKVDCFNKSPAQIEREARTLAAPNRGLLAEKVETQEIFEVCRKAGFTLFQGYFFTRPSLVHGTAMQSNRVQILRLLAELHHPDATVQSVTDLVQSDVTLAYRLMRQANSARTGRAVKFENLRDAISMLGLDRVRACAALLMLGTAADKPSELATLALVRARYCQLVGEALHEDAHKYFVVGLFSVLEAYLDDTMDHITGLLSLDRDLTEALVRRSGKLGDALDSALKSELADFDGGALSSLDTAERAQCYLSALSWANQTQASMQGL